MLALDADGTLRVLHKNAADYNEWVAIKDASGADAKIPTPAGESIHLTLRRKERGSSQFQFLVDGAPVGEPLEMTSWRGKSATTLAAVWFSSAPGGKKIDVDCATRAARSSCRSDYRESRESRTPCTRRNAGFTLIEICVIAILGLL
jgi:hypothetical protein